MKEILLATILITQILALCYMIFQVYKRKIEFDALYIWVLIVILLPIVGPIIYFWGKNSNTFG